MSRGAGEHEVFGAAYEWLGRCASCRFSCGSDLIGRTGLVCVKWNRAGSPEPVRHHHSCGQYQYEPGAMA